MMTINLIMGCMFSGKTSALINVAKMQKLLDKRVLIINFEGDQRYSDSKFITTHDKISFDCIPCGKDINDVLHLQEYITADVICINEGQFFENLVSFCVKSSKSKDIYICGLDGDYLKRPFGEILNLIPHCETVKKLQALCMSCKDGTPASFTKKTKATDNLIEIGSTDIYMPVCRLCYEI